MTRWLDRLEKRRPGFIAKIQLQILMGLTAGIFGQRSRFLMMSGYEEALRSYVQYTRELLQSCKGDDKGLLQLRMGEESYKMGRRLRRVMGLKNRRDLERLVFILYKNIGIDMSGEIPGDVCVSRCYFSNFYDPGMCRLISAMDSGIIRGIYGGGELVFSQRITEGCECCRARFDMNEDIKNE